MIARRLGLLVAVGLALLGVPGTSTGLLSFDRACAQGAGNHAAVILDTGAGVQQRCVSFSSSSISGLEALRLAGAAPQTQDFGGDAFVLGLLGISCGATSDDCTERYWAYHRAEAGVERFTYSPLGASDTTVTDGDVEGWKFGLGGAPAYADVADVCGEAAPPPRDEGRTAPPVVTTPPPLPPRPSVTTTTPPPLPAGAARRPPSTSVSGAASTVVPTPTPTPPPSPPPSTSTSTSSPMTPGPPPPGGTSTTRPSDPALDDQTPNDPALASSSGPDDPDPSGGSPWLLGGVAVFVLGALGYARHLSRRRREAAATVEA